MTASDGLKYRTLRRLVRSMRTAQSTLTRTDHEIERWLGRLLNATMSHQEKEALSIDLYDDAFNPNKDRDGLYDWEERWFAHRLPPPPAQVLVGAAGAGREAKVLADRGYEVFAIEPSARAFEHCRRRLGADATVVRASYDDLVRTALAGERTEIDLPSGAVFDAVLLGWGSFGHVLQASGRYQLLRACERLAPNGPILFSIFEPPRPHSPSSQDADAPAPTFVSWGGFLVEPTAEELAEQSRRLGRELVAALDAPSPYFTLAPRTRATGATANEHSPQTDKQERALRR